MRDEQSITRKRYKPDFGHNPIWRGKGLPYLLQQVFDHFAGFF